MRKQTVNRRLFLVIFIAARVQTVN